MILKPQDVLFLLKLISLTKAPWIFNELAISLGMSASEVHAAAKRAVVARLAVKQNGEILPKIGNLQEFLLHGIQYVFVPERGELNRGFPTSYAAEPLVKMFADNQELPQCH
ncbi:hypothetical protein MNBD_GAMMA08-2861 [hydrothermal vent metagenome]|uniref:Uncharacterized protein n=1 Tax=hydrothermal vent metagenome TaxID=652676 RepID=A0A3B0X1R6_9ZZZZ